MVLAAAPDDPGALAVSCRPIRAIGGRPTLAAFEGAILAYGCF
jgi:hypothetical protein